MSETRFTIDDLRDAFGAETQAAVAMGRWLQASIDEAAMSLPAAATGFDAATEARGGLADRVMAALANEPAPAPAGFLLPLRRRGALRGLGASVRQAWVALGGAGRPIRVRGMAFAYVLAVAILGVSLTGAATLGAAGALGILGQPTQSPAPTLPQPTLPPPVETDRPTQPPATPPVIEPSPSPSPAPEESDDDGGSGAEASDDHEGTDEPGEDRETPEPSDEAGDRESDEPDSDGEDRETPESDEASD